MMNKILFCLFLIVGQLAQADQLTGRLFSSPVERDHLDHLRKIKKPVMPVINIAPAEPKQLIERVAIELPASISMQGYVKRNDGKDSTVWINNQAMQENSGNKDVQVGSLPDNGNRVLLKLSANGRRLILKAGQVYYPEHNRVSEARSNGLQGVSGTIGE